MTPLLPMQLKKASKIKNNIFTYSGRRQRQLREGHLYKLKDSADVPGILFCAKHI